MAKGRSITLSNGLTPKQDKFVTAMITDIKDGKTPNGTQAALKAYDTTDRRTAALIASKNIRNDNVRSALDVALSSAGLMPADLMPELAKIAKVQVKTITGDTKLRAIVEVLKLQGAYPNQNQPVSGHSTVINIQNISFTEAKEKLKTLHSEASELMADTD